MAAAISALPAGGSGAEVVEPIYDKDLRSFITGQSIVTLDDPVELGSGTYGVVWNVTTPKGKVAIKLAFLEDNGVDAPTLQEIAILAKMRHPNVVGILDAVISRANIGLVLPIAGMNLRAWYNKRWSRKKRNGPGIDLPTIQFIVLQLARGIAYIQSMDVLNGDYKPENVLVYDEPDCPLRVVIADFGLATTSRCYEAVPHETYFSLWYRAPELLLDGKYTTAADSWALGCIASELLTGRPLTTADNIYDMLFTLFYRMGMPDEQSWPGVTGLRGWTRHMLKRIGKIRASSPDNTPFRSVSIKDQENAAIRYGYHRDGNRIALGVEEQTFLNSLLILDPTKRQSVLHVALSDVWLDSARRRLVATSCQSALDPGSYDCTQLLNRQLPSARLGPSKSSISPQSHILVYTWLIDTAATSLKQTDRALGIMQYLLSRYVMDKAITTDSYIVHGVAAMLIASALTNPLPIYPSEIHEIAQTAGGKQFDEEELITAQQTILFVVGVDLYVTTVYDMARLYGETYDELTEGTIRCLVLLSYISNVSSRWSVILIALSCVKLACQITAVPFLHDNAVMEHGGDVAMDGLIEAFGVSLQACFSVVQSKSVEDLFMNVQRNELSARTVLRNCALSKYINDKYLNEDEEDLRAVTEDIARLVTA